MPKKALSDITRFANSRSMVALAGILMLVAARMAFQSGEISYFSFDRGVAFESANLWISDHWLSMVVNTALILATALSWLVIVQIFNPFRAFSALPASFYLMMMLAVPDLTDQLYTGTLLALSIPLCTALLWASFADTGKLRHIFLLFAVLSALSMTQYCFAVYIPAFLIGCAQMKIFSLRTVLAMVFGLVTPWWIALGMGFVDFNDIHAPRIASFFTNFDTEETVNFILVGMTTAALLVIGWMANFMNIITLNANLRAFNGNLAVLSVFTLVAVFADFTNAAAYLPTLMLLAAYQISYMFSKSTDNRKFIPIFIIMGAYVAFFVVRILL